MKKFFKFLAVIIAIHLVGSCEYDDKFIIEEHDGQNGKDGLSTVAKVDIIYDSTGRRGVQTSYYWDSDGTPGYSTGDLPQNVGFVVWDGVNGENGKTPVMNYGILKSNNCISGYKFFFVSSLDGKVLGDTVYFCVPANGTNGANGLNGLTPTLQTIVYPYGVTYIWYLGETKISENTITHGKDGGIALALVSLTEEYDFQTGCATYITNTGFKLDGFVLSVADGALYLEKSCGSVTFPPFSENMDLLSLRFNYGSVNQYDITVKAVYEDGSEAAIKTLHLEGNPNFDRSVYETYSQFEYYANLENIQFKNIKAIKIYGALSGKCVPEDLFIDQVVICLRDKNVH